MDINSLNNSTLKIASYKEGYIDLGTCFIAPIYTNNPFDRFVLTAYHNISETHLKNLPIFAITAEETVIPLEIIYYPPDGWRIDGYDFCILKCKSEIEYIHLPATVFRLAGDIIIRGRVEGLDTEFSNIRGYSYGLEKIKDHKYKLLDIFSEELVGSHKEYIRKNDNAKAPHDIWRGISGSPIINVEDPKNPVTIGIFTRIAKNTMAGRGYGIPIENVVKACDEKNLIIHLEERKGTIETDSKDHTRKIVREILYGLEDPKREMIAWDIISGLFYQGIRIDNIVNQILTDYENKAFDACDYSVIQYFLGRLIIKKGNKKQGILLLRQSFEKANSGSEIIKKRIQTLVKFRVALESFFPDLAEKNNTINDLSKIILNLKHVQQSYVANEVASGIGRHVANLFSFPNDLNSKIKNDINKYYKMHSYFIENYRSNLKKQDIVSTNLNYLINLWEINDNQDTSEKLIRLCHEGYTKSRINKNSIFYIQSMLVQAIGMIIKNEKNIGRSLLVTIGKLLKIGGVKLEHEGINELMIYLKIKFPEYANILRIAYETCLINDLKIRSEILKNANYNLKESYNTEVIATQLITGVDDLENLYNIENSHFINAF